MRKLTTKEFIEKCLKVLGNKFDYTKVEYKNNKEKVCVICPKHGEFWIRPNDLLNNIGCPHCGGTNKSSTEEFIKKATFVHNGYFTYNKTVYGGSGNKVIVTCPVHGDFEVKASNHLNGYNCKQCQKEGIIHLITKLSPVHKSTSKYDTAFFIEKCKEIHGDKYTYEKTIYEKSSKKVIITCPVHGDFEITPNHFLSGRGCSKCSKNYRYNTEEIIEKFKQVHGDKYDYSKVEYVSTHKHITVICPEHGEFQISPANHLKGQGCIICKKMPSNKKQKIKKEKNLFEKFIEKAHKIHGVKYNYSKVEYINGRTKVCIICPEHGEFWQTADAHMRGSGCPICANLLSKPENEIFEFIKNNVHTIVEQRNKTIIKPYELDIFLPEVKFAIEYNGLYWHSTKFSTNKNKHLDKLIKCKENDIKLIQIFEDEWLNKKDIVLSKIKHLLKIDNNTKIMARKTTVSIIDSVLGIEFLNKNHIQGSGISSVYIGCFFETKLIGVMSFKKEKDNNWELTRFASDYNYTCQGVGGKLFKHFIKEYNPESVKSFADRRWTVNEENNLYLQLGFKFDSYIKPDYKYIENGIMQRQHKFNFRKSLLLKKHPDKLTKDMTESEMTDKLGYLKIYDCGLIKYIWKKEN